MTSVCCAVSALHWALFRRPLSQIQITWFNLELPDSRHPTWQHQELSRRESTKLPHLQYSVLTMATLNSNTGKRRS